MEHAIRRVEGIVTYADTLRLSPYRGAALAASDLNLRRISYRKAIYCVRIVPEEKRLVSLAIFFGGQDHETLIRERLGDPTA